MGDKTESSLIVMNSHTLALVELNGRYDRKHNRFSTCDAGWEDLCGIMGWNPDGFVGRLAYEKYKEGWHAGACDNINQNGEENG